MSLQEQEMVLLCFPHPEHVRDAFKNLLSGKIQSKICRGQKTRRCLMKGWVGKRNRLSL